jgi:SAM-dependent methyltransferase
MTQTPPQKKEDWCEEFYDDLFAEHCLKTRTPETVAGIVSFLTKALHLRAGSTVFDQCCGIGTLSVPLAEVGCTVYGVDLIPSYIEEARRAAAHVRPACHFAAGDAYAYAAPVLCDAAVNWWTSFGYAQDDAKNGEMLLRAFDSLKPGGRFALDYMNIAERLRQLGPSGRASSERDMGTCTIICNSWLEGDMFIKDWIYTGRDGKRVEKKGGGAKLYTRQQLQALFETAGFRDIAFFGSVKGESLTEDSPRCIITARRPGG